MRDEIIERIAEVAHETNRAYCAAFMDDDSQKPWSETPRIIKDSTIAGVKFFIENPNALARDSHENWYKYKKAEGWVYGEVKDVEKKTHPCMVSYENLPRTQQVKDRLFWRVVTILIDEFVV